jgi:hypothetical protein
MSQDGTKLAAVEIESQADMWLVENFDPDVD